MNFDDDLILWFIVCLIVCLLIAIEAAAYKETQEWEVFKAQHKCKVVAHIDGEIFNTFGVAQNGGMTVGIGSTSAKTGWQCDDGITYYR